MAFDLASIRSGRDAKPPRVIICGPEKVGKSTFGSMAPAPILLPILMETGLDEIDMPKTPTCTSFNTADDPNSLMSVLESLIENDVPYQTVVIDSITTLEPLIWESTCKRHGVKNIEDVLKGYGKGYAQAMQEWRELQSILDYLRDNKGIGCILVSHVKVKKFNDPTAGEPYDQYQLSIQDGAAEQLSRWADCILFAQIKSYSAKVGEKAPGKNIVHATGNGERKLYTEKHGAHPGGCRRSLPYELPFSYAAFAEAYAKASAGIPAAK